MTKFRKKPVVIEAKEVPTSGYNALDPFSDAVADLAAWCGGGVMRNVSTATLCIDIPTLEGTMRALPGDWIIKGVAGEFYPCKPDIFEATYERVEDKADE